MGVIQLHGKPSADDSGTEPPDNGDMEQRLSKLEARTAKLETELVRVEHSLKAEINKSAGDVRAELHKAINEQTWKLITWTTGLGATLVAVTFFIARNVK